VWRGVLLVAAAGLGLAALLIACAPIAVLNLAISKEGYRVEKDLAYGSDPRQKLDLYIPNALLKRGYPARVAEKVLGANFVGALGRIWG
jgi:hypothetical protein